MPRYFEDFQPGQEVWSPGRTITEADVMTFAGLSGDYNPAHTDHEFARRGPFGKPIAHGLLALIVSAGLAERDGGLDGTAVAMLGVTWRFSKPVFFGDTIRLKLTVASTRRTSRGDRGVIVRDVAVHNQHDAIVQEGSFTTMVIARPA
ncbi:MaoC/PaaZ C-terminal domain-containing protein [Labrys monachus]|uniref:Acyl dehydratase n=1 Tax=Labrys monachus TaxID=217067 RepID=A0ABU0FEP8_9HYPH|nr:MaoC/PaaZ C-terminal domain-containing protein [Labrys monachus]MDQ0393082.1 acyl dehydratase [Labrys monachus]